MLGQAVPSLTTKVITDLRCYIIFLTCYDSLYSISKLPILMERSPLHVLNMTHAKTLEEVSVRLKNTSKSTSLEGTESNIQVIPIILKSQIGQTDIEYTSC